MVRIRLPAIRGCVTLTSRWRNSGVVDGLAGSGMNSLSNTSPLDSITVSGKRGLCWRGRIRISKENNCEKSAGTVYWMLGTYTVQCKNDIIVSLFKFIFTQFRSNTQFCSVSFRSVKKVTNWRKIRISPNDDFISRYNECRFDSILRNLFGKNE